MKKSFFGFSAKIAMAVLAVCSFVLTSCYEKPAPIVEEEPEYYVTGTVYDVTTSAAINATVTVNGKAVSVSGGSFLEKLDGPGSVTVAAEAAGYVAVSRTIQVVKVGKNQVSVTSADIAMMPVGVELPENSVVAGTMTAEELVANFGFPANTEIDEDGNIHVDEDYTLEAHDGHALSHIKTSFEVKTTALTGYIWDFESEDVFVKDVMALVCNSAMESANAGNKYADFKATELKQLVNENGEECILALTICRKFSQWTVTYVFDGNVYVTNCVKAEKTDIVPEVDSHDTHGNNGGSNAGGGAGDAE